MEKMDLPRDQILDLEAIVRLTCTKLNILKDSQSLEGLFESSTLKNITVIIEHLPDIIEMLFENVMSEDVDSYMLKTPMGKMMEVKGLQKSVT